MTFFTALNEEFILRGYILSNLQNHFNPHACVIVLSIVFGLWHMQYGWVYVGMAFFLGVLMGYAYLFTQNIYFPLGLHFGWNLSEYILYSPYVSRIKVHNIFLVGARNITPEQEGFLSFVSIIVILLLLWVWYKKIKIKSHL
mgnify:CR=1 FL=1|jgi:uncharacterized protein